MKHLICLKTSNFLVFLFSPKKLATTKFQGESHVVMFLNVIDVTEISCITKPPLANNFRGKCDRMNLN